MPRGPNLSAARRLARLCPPSEFGVSRKAVRRLGECVAKMLATPLTHGMQRA